MCIALINIETAWRSVRAGAFHIHQLCQPVVQQIGCNQPRRNTLKRDRLRQKGSIAPAYKDRDGLVQIRDCQVLLSIGSKFACHNLDRASAGGRATTQCEKPAPGAEQDVDLVGLVVNHSEVWFSVIVEVTAHHTCGRRAGRITLTGESNVRGVPVAVVCPNEPRLIAASTKAGSSVLAILLNMKPSFGEQ